LHRVLVFGQQTEFLSDPLFVIINSSGCAAKLEAALQHLDNGAVRVLVDFVAQRAAKAAARLRTLRRDRPEE
jgi:hypothetical protein